MLRWIGRAIQVLLGLVVVLAAIGGIGWLFYTTVTEAPAVVAAVVTGFGALFGVAVQRYLEHQREDERSRRERMTPIYETLVGVFQQGEVDGGEEEMEAFFRQLTQGLLLWGNPAIVGAFNEWRRAAATLDEDNPEVLFAGERLLFAVRSDLGQSNEGLGPGDLLRVWVNDVDEYLPGDDQDEGKTAAA